MAPNTTPENQAKPDSAPTREEILQLLNSEIKEIQAAEARNGLNLWVVLAAIVGLLWVLSGELKYDTVNATTVTRIFVTFSLLIDGLRLLYNTVGAQSAGSDEVRFHWSDYVLGKRRAFSVVEIIRCAALLVLLFVSNALPMVIAILTAIFYSVYLFISSIAFAGSFRPLFVVSPDARNKFTYAYWVLLLGGLLLSVSQLIPLLPKPNSISIADYRIAGILAGISYLAVMFGFVLSSSSFVPTLERIRRSLATGKMTLSDAIHEIEVTLGGMREADELRADYIALMELLEGLDQQTNNALIAIASIEKNLVTSQDAPEIAVSKRDTTNSLVAGYRFFLSERQRIFERYVQQLSHFSKLARKVNVIVTCRPTVAAIQRLIDSRAATVDSNFAVLQKREAEVDKKLQITAAPFGSEQEQVPRK